MGLRETATADLNTILSDNADFAYDITLTNPGEDSLELLGYTTDISQIIDPDTGQIVSGRSASVALSMRVLKTAGFDIPQGITDETKKPWRIEFNDLDGASYTFAVQSSNPDRALGIVTCELELYTAPAELHNAAN